MCGVHGSGARAVRGPGLDTSLGLLKSGVNFRVILGRGQRTMAWVWGNHTSVMDGKELGRWVGLEVPS